MFGAVIESVTVWGSASARAESVEDEREHPRRSIFRGRCGSPQRSGELEEVGGIGVGADGPVALASVEELRDCVEDRDVRMLGDRLVRARAERLTKRVFFSHGADQVG